jgi:hypothetical protein
LFQARFFTIRFFAIAFYSDDWSVSIARGIDAGAPTSPRTGCAKHALGGSRR